MGEEKATRLQKIQEGLTILAGYGADDLTAEHDQIWAVGDYTAGDVSNEDAKKLEELGWHVDEEAWTRFV